jgi:5-formyltetrahydrofolate cyclo-ligase
MGTSIAIAIIVILVFSSSAIVELIQRKRRDKNGDSIIKEPWVEIHQIPGYRDARKVAAFYPMKGEPNLLPIVDELAQEGRLLLPKVTGDTTMEFYPIDNLKKDLAQGKFGIMEPRDGLEPWNGDITVFLVPGTKFNWDGSRQGHGKGYYDRYLAKFPSAYKAGIATPAQISETPLEQKDTDIKMNTIIACRERY